MGVRGSIGREEALTSEAGGRVHGGNYELYTRNRPNDFVQRPRGVARVFACFLL